jgi:hypothetical protein
VFDSDGEDWVEMDTGRMEGRRVKREREWDLPSVRGGSTGMVRIKIDVFRNVIGCYIQASEPEAI